MKSAIKKLYIEKLQSTYPFYAEGSKPLAMANQAADAALSGKIKLDGDCWNSAVKEVTGLSRWTMRNLAELPD